MAEDVGGSIDPQKIEARATAADERPFARFRIPIAFVALVVWLVLTTSNPFHVHASTSLIGALTDGPQWGILLAALFLIILTALFRWNDLGLNAPISAKSLLLLWLPAIYLLLFFAVDVVVGPPSLTVVGFLLLNVIMGGFSEEMMFRGVLFAALRTRLHLAPAAIISTVLFGCAHLVNVAVFGNLEVAAAQAVAATMSGFVFIAIRLRTGSLFPAIAYHALWDFGSLMIIARSLSSSGPAGLGGVATGTLGGTPPLGLLVGAVILVLPNFLYALFLLRRSRLANL